MAFFPCIKFCSVMEQMQHEDFYDASQRKRKDYGTQEYFIQKWKTLRNQSQERFYFYDVALKFAAICQIKGLRMIMENPWHPTNFTNHFWFLRTSVIDNDRTRRGDYFRKPTAYWFINCDPTYGFTEQTDKKRIRILDCKGGIEAGMCSEERSMISPDYARNFICDFILGKEQEGTQLSIF